MRISEVLDQSAATSPSSPCVIYQQRGSNDPSSHLTSSLVLTYEAAQFALKEHEKSLRKTRINCPAKELVVAFLASNSLDLLLATLACTNLGKSVVPVLLNTRWTPQEIAKALESQNLADETLLVHDNFHASRAQTAAELLRQNHSQVSTFSLPLISTRYLQKTCRENLKGLTTTQQIPPARMNVSDSNKEDIAIILFTSGTTSGSKGVLLSHRALSIQAMAKLRSPCKYSKSTKMLATTVPLFHVGGLSSALAVWMAGGALVFPSFANDATRGGGFRPDLVLQSLQYGSFLSSNTLVVVPAMLSPLLETLKNNPKVFPDVGLVLIGGQSAPQSVLKHVFQRFPNARVVQTYACTEGASSLTFLEMKRSALKPDESFHMEQEVMSKGFSSGDCVGVPPPHIQLCLVPTNSTSDNTEQNIDQIEANTKTSPFTPGVIATRGPHLFTGYWRRGAHSIRSYDSPMTQDGWFITNDLGYRDTQGRFYFCGRVHDVIRTGGETVLATEVERVLLDHHAVAECAVFALPDLNFGEAVCAAIVLENTTAVSEPIITLKDVREWCAKRGLAGYKRPRRIFVVSELPRNSSGKLLKRLLVERFRRKSATTEIASFRSKL